MDSPLTTENIDEIRAAATARHDPERRLHQKYIVLRTDGRDGEGEKHAGCECFVLDLTHDPYARAAYATYADACAVTEPRLAADIRFWLAMNDD